MNKVEKTLEENKVHEEIIEPQVESDQESIAVDSISEYVNPEPTQTEEPKILVKNSVRIIDSIF